MKFIILILISILFLGCSQKKENTFFISKNIPKAYVKMNSLRKTILEKNKYELYYATTTTYCYGIGRRELLIKYTIKKIAENTLQEGKKYFFIVSPNEVSNYRGRTINNINDFMENMNYDTHTEWNTHSETISVELYFVMLNEKSIDFVVWDAQKTLKDL